MQIAAGANASAETGGDFVIAQINVRTTAWTIGRGGRVTDLVLSLAFETGDAAASLPMPKTFRFSETGGFRCGRRLLFRSKL